MPKRGPGSVRVIAGSYRGLRLETRRGEAVRPTADRVKEALFSILGSALDGAAVVDCFAGTGALGIEALSRGAGRVAFVENDARTLSLLRKNLNRLSVPVSVSVSVLEDDGLRPERWGRGVLPVDVILADPPYRRGLGGRLLEAIDPGTALSPGGILVLEHEKDDVPGNARWQAAARRRYGDTVLSLYTP